MFDTLRAKAAQLISPRAANAAASSIYKEHDDFWFMEAGSSSVSLSEAQKLTAVNACIRICRDAGAMLPVNVKRRVDERGAYEIVETNNVHRMLAVEPNEYQTPYEFRQELYGGLAAHGELIVEKRRLRNGTVGALWPISAGDVTVEWFDRRTGRERIYDVSNHHDGRARVLTDSDVWHPRLASLDGGLTGASPIALNSAGLSLAISSHDYASSFFDSGARMAGFSAPDGDKLTMPQQKQLDKAMNKEDEGRQMNPHHKYRVFGRPMKFHQVSVGPEDADLVLMMDWTLADVARIWGVPLWLLQATMKTTATGKSTEQEGIGFDTYTLSPFVTAVEESVKRWLLIDPKLYFDTEMDVLKRADMKTRFEAYAYSSNANRPWLTTNEIRHNLGMPPDNDPDSDKIISASNNTPDSGAGGDDGTNGVTQEDDASAIARIQYTDGNGETVPCATPE